MRKKTILLLVSVLGFALNGAAAAPMAHEHGTMPASTPLTEPGNAAFATIQEAVGQLLADPNTDWSRVDLEALRRHLVDMDNFTLHVEVVEQKPVEGGVEFTVKPATPEAAGSLKRLFAAHPAILKQESGWDMQVQKHQDAYTAVVTSTKPEDVARIRGLGYIGIVAYGKHHQLHHWLMATGTNPHQHHH